MRHSSRRIRSRHARRNATRVSISTNTATVFSSRASGRPEPSAGRQLDKSKAERALERELLDAASNDAAAGTGARRVTVTLNGRAR